MITNKTNKPVLSSVPSKSRMTHLINFFATDIFATKINFRVQRIERVFRLRRTSFEFKEQQLRFALCALRFAFRRDRGDRKSMLLNASMMTKPRLLLPTTTFFCLLHPQKASNSQKLNTPLPYQRCQLPQSILEYGGGVFTMVTLSDLITSKRVAAVPWRRRESVVVRSICVH